MTDRKIVTSYVYPPIPFRGADWCAYFDGEEEGLTGWGRTEPEAVQDLLDQEEADREEEARENGQFGVGA